MNSAVLFLSALLALSAASAVVYKEEELQFDAMEKMPKEMSSAIAQFKDYFRTLPEEPSGSQDISNIQASISKIVYVSSFGAGMAIEVRYITPNNGRPTLDLRDRYNNIVLHVNPRWDKKVFVLNTLHRGRWGPEERPGGFDFSSGVPITIRIEAANSGYVILVNGNVVHRYKHRLSVSSIRKIHFHWGGAASQAYLISLGVFF